MLASPYWGKQGMALLTLSIMLTCGMVNAGFIVLAITGEESLSDLAWESSDAIAGIICAAIGGTFSGYGQKSIYLESLNNFEKMCHEGILNDIKGNKIYIFILAVICALCSFIVNLGMASLGIGVLIGTGTPVLLGGLAVLFALANALLVFYTAIDALKKGETLPQCFKNNKMLGGILALLFAGIAAWGLVMTFYPGMTQVLGKYADELGGKIVFGCILGLALITETYYSFTKACHLANMFIKREFPSFWNMVAILFNAAINSTAGIDGGFKFAEDVGEVEEIENENDTEAEPTIGHTNETIAIQAVGCFSGAGWSMTCSAPLPKDTPEDTNKKSLIINQFRNFTKTTSTFHEHADPDGTWKLKVAF